ncbi:MAG: carbon-nitrogen hydrolase family protein [Congregibacter sp.]
MTRMVKLAAAHVTPVFMDAKASAEKATQWIEQAGKDGVELLVFPEVFLPGFPYWINCYPPLIQADMNTRYQRESVTVDGPEVAMLVEAARAAGVSVVMGASERRIEGRTCHNSAIFITPGEGVVGVHRKLQPTFAERYIWGQGDGSTLIAPDMPVGRVSALCCWEHTMNLARQSMIELQAEIHAALWPSLSTLMGFDAIADLQIEAMMRNHALTGGCFVVAAANPVGQDVLDFLDAELGPQEFLSAGGGWSSIIHPFTPSLAGPHTGSEEMLVTADVDLDEIHGVKQWLDGTGHYARPEILKLVVDRRVKATAEYIDE